MKVELLSYTQPSERFAENMTELVAFCARVSNPGNQHNHETSEKLIRYLIKHQHWSPLEMVSVCLEIEKAQAVAQIGTVIINSAKIEVDYVKATGMISTSSDLFKGINDQKQIQ